MKALIFRCRLARLAVVGAMLLFAISALSAEPIKVVVPTPAGGSLDVMARVLADQIGRTQGPTMIIENRPGASSIVGTEAVSRAVPDGKTLLATGTSLVISSLLHKTNYDPLTSFEPICRLVSLPTVIAVSSKSPYSTLVDLLHAAGAKPGQLTLASMGPGSTTQLAFEMLKREAKVDMTFVPYPGTAPALDAAMAQHVTAYFGEYSGVGVQMKAGTLRALAVASPRRLDLLPEVPTLAELGFEDVMGDIWFGVLAPAKTAKEATDRLAALYTAALQVPEVKAKFFELGLYPAGICGSTFGAFLRKQFDEYGRIIGEAGIKVD